MKTFAALVFLSCLTAGCDEDPARKVKIISRPLSQVATVSSIEAATRSAENSAPRKESSTAKPANTIESNAKTVAGGTVP